MFLVLCITSGFLVQVYFIKDFLIEILDALLSYSICIAVTYKMSTSKRDVWSIERFSLVTSSSFF